MGNLFSQSDSSPQRAISSVSGPQAIPRRPRRRFDVLDHECSGATTAINIPGAKNLRWCFENGRILLIEIMNLSQSHGASSTGKTITVASSCGHKDILQSGAVLNLQAYLPVGTAFARYGLGAFRTWKTNNIELTLDGLALRLKIDLSVQGVLASSGKFKLLACTNGNHELGHSNIFLGCQVMAKPDAIIDLSCLRSCSPAAKRLRRSKADSEEDMPERVDVHVGGEAVVAAHAFTAHFFPTNPKSLAALMATLNQSRATLDIAIFMFTEDKLAKLVLKKHKAGVKVRIICDNDMDEDMKTSDIDELEAAGVEVRRDHSRLHMHHKFAVIDKFIVVNGSFNWTSGAIQQNQENIVVSRCKSIADAFQNQFDQMWRALGPGCRHDVMLSPAASFQDGCAVLFFPDKNDANLSLLLDELRSARKSLDVCVFTLTLPNTIRLMKDLHRKKVRVRVVSDNRCAAFRSGAVRKDLVDAGIGFRVDASPFHMHHKFAIVDGHTVINGSFNWTRRAENGNKENIIIHRNVPSLASAFQAEFEGLWRKFA